jgi:hypothetical protein
MVVFTNASAFCKIEEIKSASSSIFVGKRMILGTGSFSARIDAEALNEAERVRNEDRINNPDKYIGYTNDEYMAIASEMKQDDTKITHNDDSENSFGIIGIGKKASRGAKSTKVVFLSGKALKTANCSGLSTSAGVGCTCLSTVVNFGKLILFKGTIVAQLQFCFFLSIKNKYTIAPYIIKSFVCILFIY